MTAIPNSNQVFNTTNLSILHSELIPECTNTYEYAEFAKYNLNKLENSLQSGQVNEIEGLLRGISSAQVSDRRALVGAFQAAHPALFKRLYGDLITFFYSTEEAQKRIHDLANQAPREASADFDPALLDAVITNQSGKRRL